MIGYLSGSLLECGPGRLVVQAGGVGYLVEIPLGAYYALSGKIGDQVNLHIHTRVREDALTLYGFVDRDERTAFERLTAISGVGPKLALAVLSGIGVRELHETVFQDDRDRLQKIPGVGKKTAERILLELRDRLERELGPGGRQRATAAAAGQPPETDESSTPLGDAVSALENLGYPRDRAHRAVRGAAAELDESASLEAILRAALSGLVR